MGIEANVKTIILERFGEETSQEALSQTSLRIPRTHLEKMLVDFAISTLHEGAALVIFQRFCRELVKWAEKHPKRIPISHPEGRKILAAIKFLEKTYPSLKKEYEDV